MANEIDANRRSFLGAGGDDDRRRQTLPRLVRRLTESGAS